VLPRTFDHYHVKVGLPAGSALREPLNRALLKVLEEGTWRQRAERYIGPDH
jgi:ABC-type amino acid transport substrate-binding protein